ncbi:MAG: glycosyltransferase [Thermoleophilia bacterium]
MDLDDAVVFSGFRRDVERVLPRLDVFCQPSLSEGLPFALLEAAAASAPCW